MPEAAMHDTYISSVKRQVEDFFLLTRQALDADSAEDFFNILTQREALCSNLELISSSLSTEYIAQMLMIERKILERLEGEKRKIMSDIDRLSLQMKTARLYSAKFPFPAMPAFFVQTG